MGIIAFIPHHQLVDFMCELLCLQPAVVHIGLRQDDSEFIPAKPPHDIGLARMAQQQLRDTDQHLIARRMTEHVIDLFEMVEVDIDDGQGRTKTGRKGNFAPDLALEGPPVEDRAQRIIVCQRRGLIERFTQVVHIFAKYKHFITKRFDGGARPEIQRREVDAQHVQQGQPLICLRSVEIIRHAGRLSKYYAEIQSFLPYRRTRGQLTRQPAYLCCALSSARLPMTDTDSPKVGIIMGSQSDWPVMRLAAEILEELGVSHETRIVSAHRTPERLVEYAKAARGRGLKVIIAGAGGAAHLPGMTASMTPLPVLGVPVQSRALSGMDSLLSIVQMPKGVPVGTLAIGEAGAANAGLLAASIIALQDPAVADKLDAFRQAQSDKIGESPEA